MDHLMEEILRQMKYYHSALNYDKRWQLQRENSGTGTNSNIGNGTGIEPGGREKLLRQGCISGHILIGDLGPWVHLLTWNRGAYLLVQEQHMNMGKELVSGDIKSLANLGMRKGRYKGKKLWLKSYNFLFLF